MEEAISSTNKDISRLEDEILALLTALKVNDKIEEVGMLEIPKPKRRKSTSDHFDESVMDVDEVEVLPMSTQRGSLRKKTQPLSRSQAKTKSAEIDSAPLPMELGGVGLNNTNRSCAKTHHSSESYALIESSVFLLPVLDTWVLGMTLVNSSKIAQVLPELLLNLVPTEGSSVAKPCRVFTYSVQVTPLDTKHAAMPSRKVHGGIPYQDTFRTKKDILENCLIQPGCQLLLTATFGLPLWICNSPNSFDILASVCLQDQQLWSGRVPLALSDEAFCNFNLDLYETHQFSILSAFGKHQECFKMKRLLTHGNKIPHKAIEKFLLPLGFENIMSEQVGVDTSIEVFASNEFATMWGLTFKIEKCFRSSNTIRCLVSARSERQMQIFMKVFSSWIKRESQLEQEDGFKGLIVVRMKSGEDDEVNMVKTLRSEISTLSRLGQLDQKRKLKSGSSKPDCQWIEHFIETLSATDAIFMHYMSDVNS